MCTTLRAFFSSFVPSCEPNWVPASAGMTKVVTAQPSPAGPSTPQPAAEPVPLPIAPQR